MAPKNSKIKQLHSSLKDVSVDDLHNYIKFRDESDGEKQNELFKILCAKVREKGLNLRLREKSFSGPITGNISMFVYLSFSDGRVGTNFAIRDRLTDNFVREQYKDKLADLDKDYQAAWAEVLALANELGLDFERTIAYCSFNELLDRFDHWS